MIHPDDIPERPKRTGPLLDQFGRVMANSPQPYTEKMIYGDEGKIHFVKTQQVDHIIDAAKDASEAYRKDGGPAGGRFLGTVPILIAQQWATECGAAIGTKEWAKYAKEKLRDGTWAKLRVHG